MKRTILLLAISIISFAGMAQSEKYTKAMKEKVAAVDTTREPSQLIDLSAAFERIATAEKTQWHPYYYAALTQANAALMMGMNGGGNSVTIDPMADKAEQLLNTAESMSKNNSEIFIVKKLIASARMMVDPMTRYMKYGALAAAALETAKKLNPENPRVYLLEGQDKYFTPEQYGGSKTEAKALFETASKKFETFKPATELDPSWGRPSVQYFINLSK